MSRVKGQPPTALESPRGRRRAILCISLRRSLGTLAGELGELDSPNWRRWAMAKVLRSLDLLRADSGLSDEGYLRPFLSPSPESPRSEDDRP